jgi:hypothetical protein
MLKRGFKQMLAEANAVIESVSVQDLHIWSTIRKRSSLMYARLKNARMAA